ncbi:ABC transporter substrate-binding protein [Cohnella sp. 56]|uniref:ABC transporter substrate-binding protein n=1 Tax=Cohnella sp. 56 TaxID=3113722 RepID=UPI0030EA385B
MKKLAALAALALLLTAVGGCVKGGPSHEASKTLTVACCSDYIYDLWYRDFIETGFPDWDVKFVPMSQENSYTSYDQATMSAFLDHEKPDLMIVDSAQYRLLRSADKLQNMDGWAASSKTKLTELVTPGVLEYLRGESGSLYALGPSFHANALYYNKDILDQLGVPYPSESIGWEQLLELAGRVMQDPRRDKDTAGLFIPQLRSPFDLLRQVAGTEGLAYANLQSGTVTFDSPGWERLFKLVVSAYERGVFTMESAGMDNGNLFQQGHAAFTIDYDSLYPNLRETAKFGWGMTAPPARSGEPGRAGEIQMFNLFAIPAGAGHAEQAWEAISYFMSERVGRARAGLLNADGLPVQRDYPALKQDSALKIFYEPLPTNSLDKLGYGINQGPGDFDASFAELVNGHIRSVLADKETSDAAFKAIQPEAERLMQKALAEQKATTRSNAETAGS